MLLTKGFQYDISTMNFSIMCHFSTCFGALAEFPRIFWKTQGFTLNENAFVYNGCLVRVGFPFSLQSCSTVFRGKYFFSRAYIYIRVKGISFWRNCGAASVGEWISLTIRSDEGLTLETSAFQSLYGGQFPLSTPLINQIFLQLYTYVFFFSIQKWT